MRTQPGFFSLSGEGICVGRESADAVSKEYEPPFTFAGGDIAQVEINVSGEPYGNRELDARGAFARD
jgi:hypothetical protein